MFSKSFMWKIVFGLPTTYSFKVNQQTDDFHDIPSLLDLTILENAARIVKNINYVVYQLAGEVEITRGYPTNSKVFEEVFHIGVELIDFIPVITHHVFIH
jgi:hypothetical protein